jgi:hypothetical protein
MIRFEQRDTKLVIRTATCGYVRCHFVCLIEYLSLLSHTGLLNKERQFMTELDFLLAILIYPLFDLSALCCVVRITQNVYDNYYDNI